MPPLPSVAPQQDVNMATDVAVSAAPSRPPQPSLTARLRCVRRRRSAALPLEASAPSGASISDPRLTLQKVRVELEKMPLEEELPPPPQSAAKRRHSDATSATATTKKAKGEEKKVSESLPLTDSRLLFAALRKSKLDEFLNLTDNSKQIKQEEEEKRELRANKTDLFLISQLKQLNKV